MYKVKLRDDIKYSELKLILYSRDKSLFAKIPAFNNYIEIHNSVDLAYYYSDLASVFYKEKLKTPTLPLEFNDSI